VALVTHKKSKKLFLVLVPHRDIRLVLRKYSASLFKAGFAEAYNFPWVAPLAAISRALDDAQLKHFSRFLREAAGEKIRAGKAAFCAFQDAALFGPSVELGNLSDILGKGALKNAAEKVTEIFPDPVIGTCLLRPSHVENAALPEPPQLSFRAAAAANFFWKSEEKGGAVSVKWKIGKLFWLPAAGK